MNDEGQALRGGRYVTTRVLGGGAQGDTLEAVDKREGRLVAIKRFRIRGAASWKNVELAEREARVLASLSHPSLPAHIEHFEEDGALYLVMEKIEGESVGALRRRGVQLGREDVLRFLRDASDVLDYLHGRAPPVIHRDIKPNNVLRRPDGSFAIVDFGAVRDRLRPEGGSTVVGTFGYMAPEQFQGRALPSSDVYAVGATALAMLTGAEPEDLPHQGLAIDVAAALGGSADPALARTLSAMLEPDPDRRAHRLRPLLEALEAARRSRDAAYGGAPPPRATRPPGERSRESRGGHEQRTWDRHAERRRERAAHKAERRALRKIERRARRVGLGGLPRTLVLLALAIARFAVAIALTVVVPFVLTILSLVFGGALRVAAARVREAQRDADRAIVRAADAIGGVDWEHETAARSDGAHAARATEPRTFSPDPSRTIADEHEKPRVSSVGSRISDGEGGERLDDEAEADGQPDRAVRRG